MTDSDSPDVGGDDQYRIAYRDKDGELQSREDVVYVAPKEGGLHLQIVEDDRAKKERIPEADLINMGWPYAG